MSDLTKASKMRALADYLDRLDARHGTEGYDEDQRNLRKWADEEEARPAPVVTLPINEYYDTCEGRVRYYDANKIDAALAAAGIAVSEKP